MPRTKSTYTLVAGTEEYPIELTSTTYSNGGGGMGGGFSGGQGGGQGGGNMSGGQVGPGGGSGQRPQAKPGDGQAPSGAAPNDATSSATTQQ